MHYDSFVQLDRSSVSLHSRGSARQVLSKATALHPAVLHFDLHPQVTSSRQASGIGGSLDHTVCMPPDSFFQAQVSVGDATSICSLSAYNQILAWWFAHAAWSSKASLVGGNISRALLPFLKRYSLAWSTVGCAGVPCR